MCQHEVCRSEPRNSLVGDQPVEPNSGYLSANQDDSHTCRRALDKPCDEFMPCGPGWDLLEIIEYQQERVVGGGEVAHQRVDDGDYVRANFQRFTCT